MSGLAAVPPENSHDREITAFFAEHRYRIRRWLKACGCPEHEVDDVVQESILAVREQWDHVRSYEVPRAYWYKVALRRFQRWQAERAGRYYPGDDQLEALRDQGDVIALAEDRELAMTIIRELPMRQRQVFWLRRAAGFTIEETAEILSVTSGTVKSQLHDAEARVLELAAKHGGDAAGPGPALR